MKKTSLLLFIFLFYICLYGQTVSYKTTWIGNSFGGGEKWVQDFLEGMFVSPDGTVYTASVWDEAGREFGFYKNGDVVGYCKETHGWGTLGGYAITANSKYIFIAHLQGNEGGHLQGKEYPPKGMIWAGISRYNKDGTLAPFPNGGGRFGAMLILHTLPEPARAEDLENAQVHGLAADEKRLYVSDQFANTIKVYDVEKMELLRQWKVEGPRQLALDKQGTIWLIQKVGKIYRITRFTTDGKQLPQLISFPPAVLPTALCIDNAKGRLLVTDNGESQQILIYGDLEKQPKLIGKFGEKGGIYGGKNPGVVGPLRFAGLKGVGVDDRGNIYIGCSLPSCGTVIRAFSSQGKLLWELLGLEFVHTADADPATDAQDLYTPTKHYKMDWNKTKPGSEWRWFALTINPFRYPHDPRLDNLEAPLIRYIKGRKYLIVRGMYEHALLIYRFDGEIAVPSVIFSREHWKSELWKNVPQPGKGRWIWRDKNGDGEFQADEFYDADGVEEPEFWAWWVDEEGGVWYGLQDGKIYYFPLLGIDQYGNPIYSREKALEFQMPPPLNHLLRIEYHPQNDVMFLSGYTEENPKRGGEWGIVGTEILRFDDWMKGNRQARWRAKLIYEPEETFIKAFCTAGDYLFAVECRSAKVHIYSLKTGEKIGEMSPGPEVASESGWVDFPDAIRAYKRKDGEYLVSVEEDWKNKVIVYRWRPARNE
ncbi:beta-propeller fold lactonase family protein [bacterium]|nr:beta-propeller fold lactonase family protein [bacterium]